MRRIFLLFSALLLCLLTANAQQTANYTNELRDYNKALELFKNGQYLAAQSEFNKLSRATTDQGVKADCAYYVANCAVRLGQADADVLMERFVAEYPTSLKRNQAYLEVANYYFDNGKYAYARKWYDKVDESSLARTELERFYFNNGYAYFKNDRYTEAEKFFNRVADSPEYGSQAKYYLGYIAYEGDDYEQANQLFETVGDNERYAEGMSYYKADMNFKLGRFQDAIDLAMESYPDSRGPERSELAKIIGESYFNLGDYAQAIGYLQEYKGKKGRWNNTDYYQLGYAHYQQKDYQAAVDEFNKIVDGRNAVAQNAYYHLAESYLQLDLKQQALNAFKNASEMDFSLQIQEDAWLNYAKLSYEIGNSYQSVPEVLLSYLQAYPDSDHNDLVEDLLIDSYISSRNYAAALVLLEDNKRFSNKKAYQQVAFFRGVELYNEGAYDQAVALFDKSLKEPIDAVFTARAIYWKAESDYQNKNYDESLLGFKQFLQLPQAAACPEYANSAYSLGYNYFQLKNYPDAIDQYTVYVASATNDMARKNDAYLRLGDSHFVSSDYWKAMEHYNKAIEGNAPDKDYAAFQKAISYGFVEKRAEKRAALERFATDYPKSFYRDDALYELGNTYLSEDRTREAITTYDRIFQEFPASSYVPKALLKKALILDNGGESELALRQFKRVANDYPGSEEALQAVASAKIIYIDQGKVNEYADWVSTLDFVSVDNAELDNASFAAAEQPYLENRLGLARSRFETYLQDHPNGQHALKAHFYLAQMYFTDDDRLPAIPHYRFVADLERNEFTEQALARLSELYLADKDYASAIVYLKRLELEADFPQNRVFAQTNAMKASFELKQYQEAVEFAEKVLLNEKVDNNIKSDAQVIVARSAMETADLPRAKTAYAEVLKIATGRLAAEAMYYKAFFQNQEGDYTASNQTVQQLAKDYSGYKLYGAKGLVLMAKNFFMLDDAFQATYILESVISNFTDFPDLIEEAKAELSIIKAAASKTNSSVETEQN